MSATPIELEQDEIAADRSEGESTRSVWKSVRLPHHPALERNTECEVCIVGAGIAGMSVAYRLAREGQNVVLLDAYDIGRGETGQTTAHLASALDDHFYELERVHGTDGARLAYGSHAAAINEIERIIDREGIACAFTRLDGYLFLGPEDDDRSLDRELAAATRIGFPGVAKVPRAPIASFDTGPALVFPSQARFHPLLYLAGLAAAIERYGGTIRGSTMVTKVDGGKRPKVTTQSGREIRAKAVIVATNGPFHPRIALHSKQAPYRTYAIALSVPRGAIVDALYWDTCDPYHYVRLESGPGDFDQLIVGGEDHRSGTRNDAYERYERLESWARKRFPNAADLVYRWSGQVYEPFDYLAFIGRDPSGERNVYVATGDSGHGMTHGTIAGILLSDLVLGRANPWSTLYDPSRKTAKGAGEYVRDNLDVAAAMTDWVKPRPTLSAANVPAGEGAILQRGLRKIAVFRDWQGVLHERSAICPHMGCIVRWNGEAKSWDCPCHGSRFSPTGEVLNGPAQTALGELKKSAGSGRLRSAVSGAFGGAVATVAMTGMVLGAQKLGLLGELPPRKIVKGLRRQMGIFGMSSSSDDMATTLAHLGFGTTAGAIFGALRRKPAGLVASSLLGVAYGISVWAMGYCGVAPALGLMRKPNRDRTFRPSTMIAGHIVYGGVLGAITSR